MRTRTIGAVVAFAVVLAAPATAPAAMVTLEPVYYCTGDPACRYMDSRPGVFLRYAGEGAEDNRVTVRRDGDELVIAETTASLHPGVGCGATGVGTARCALGGLPLAGYRLDGRDGADVIAVTGGLAPAPYDIGYEQPHLLLGGPGEDVLLGGDDVDTLIGGPGADRLVGGAGDDRFFRDFPSGRQEPAVDGAEPDVVDGGPAATPSTTSRACEGLRIELGGPEPGGGEPGERDRLQAVEVVIGGAGGDLLTGGPSDELLLGNDGADVLHGGAGADRLIGGPGTDVLWGNEGDDRLGLAAGYPRAPEGTADRAICGPGRDVIGQYEDGPPPLPEWTPPNADDVVALDCELVPFEGSLFGGADPDSGVRAPPGSLPGVDPRPLRRGRRAWIMRNPCATVTGSCSARLELARPGHVSFARGSAAAGRPRLTVRLGPLAGRRLARATRVAIAVRVRRPGLRNELAFVIALR